jgi:dsRNA-specific ribonuclease
MLSVLASNARLAVLGRKIGLAREQTRAGDIQVADTVEAIIGAIVLDGGREALPRVMQRFGFFDTSEMIVLYSQSKKRVLKDDVTRGIKELQKQFNENDVR